MKNFLFFLLAIFFLFMCSVKAQETYKWDNVAIGGGGYVTGLVIHPTEANLMYMRTDIGGIFKWDNSGKRWKSLSGWISPDKDNLFGVDGIALDKNNANVVYACLGKYAPNSTAGDAGIYKSTDRGVSWNRVYAVPFGGNWCFRWVGEPIVVDPNNSAVVYCGTRRNGLVRSTDSGAAWGVVSGVPFGNTGDASNPWPGANVSDGATNNPIGIRCVVIDPNSTSGGKSKNVYVAVYGTGIYRSTDAGSTFSLIAGSPFDVLGMTIAPGNILYVTTLDNGVKKYNGSWTNLPVPTDAWSRFNGITVDPFDANRIYVTTCSQNWWQRLYRSTNGGNSWQSVYSYDGTATIHDKTWHSGNLGFSFAATAAIVLDPNQQGRMYATDWYQVWRSDNAWAPVTDWYNDVEGHEEVVPLALCTPHTGVQLFSGHGDVLGFKHTDQAVIPTKQLVAKGECTSIDYSESTPASMAIVTASDWYGANTEIFTSSNTGDNWTAVSKPSGGTNGKIAIAANDPQKMVYLYGNSVPYYTANGGVSWAAAAGAPSTAMSTTYMYQYDDPLVADRTAANTFYLLDRVNGDLYKSTNGGANWSATFTSLPSSSNESNLVVGWGSSNNRIAVSMRTDGLWLSTTSGTSFTKNTYFSNALMVTMGKEKSGNSYPALYVFGEHSSQWGVYRSDDFGANWVRINDNNNYVGNSPTYMKGDRQEYGRVYIGNNGSGLFYGAIAGGTTTPPSTDNNSIIVRAKMISGTGGKIELKINDTTVQTWTLTDSYADYSYSTTAASGNVKVYFQDNIGDAQIDYINLKGTVLQAENMTVNTSVWQNNTCGGASSELMHCPGYIDFGTIDGGGKTPTSLVTNYEFNNGTTGWTTFGGGSTIAVNTAAGMSGTNAGKVSIPTATSNRWDVGLSTSGIALTNRTTYTISFLSKADSNKPVQVDILDNGAWKFGFYPTITNSVATYTYTFTANNTSSNYQLNFLLGGNTTSFFIDKIIITSEPTLKLAALKPGTLDQESLSSTIIYPNPSNGNFKLNTAGRTKVDVYDLIGVLKFSKIIEDNDDSTIQTGLPAGVYIIKASNEENTTTVKLIIK